MLDVASALIRQPLPKGKRVGIVTAGGGFGVVAADACRSLGLEVPTLSKGPLKVWIGLWNHAGPIPIR